MARYRRKRRSNNFWWLAAVGVVVIIVGYGWFVSPVLEDESSTPTAQAPEPTPDQDAASQPARKLSAQRPSAPAKRSAPVADIQTSRPKRSADKPKPSPTPPRDEAETSNAAARQFAAGVAAMERGDLVIARQALADAFARGLPAEKSRQARERLFSLAQKTIFSSAIIDDDPLAGRHVVQTGETLGKIAKTYDITAGLIAQLNNIDNPNMIRVGQSLKVLNGPFHAVIDKGSFTMYLYLGDTPVRAFKVGLGANDNTPSGDWKVGSKLTNPTYYPPRGGKVVASDDPNNPLGEHWIALVGISGEAVGQQRYGIHGTNEPESIGRDMSLGCVRMHNEDVAQVYNMLIPGKSIVSIRD